MCILRDTFHQRARNLFHFYRFLKVSNYFTSSERGLRSRRWNYSKFHHKLIKSGRRAGTRVSAGIRYDPCGAVHQLLYIIIQNQAKRQFKLHFPLNLMQELWSLTRSSTSAVSPFPYHYCYILRFRPASWWLQGPIAFLWRFHSPYIYFLAFIFYVCARNYSNQYMYYLNKQFDFVISNRWKFCLRYRGTPHSIKALSGSKWEEKCNIFLLDRRWSAHRQTQ